MYRAASYCNTTLVQFISVHTHTHTAQKEQHQLMWPGVQSSDYSQRETRQSVKGKISENTFFYSFDQHSTLVYVFVFPQNEESKRRFESKHRTHNNSSDINLKPLRSRKSLNGCTQCRWAEQEVAVHSLFNKSSQHRARSQHDGSVQHRIQ